MLTALKHYQIGVDEHSRKLIKNTWSSNWLHTGEREVYATFLLEKYTKTEKENLRI